MKILSIVLLALVVGTTAVQASAFTGATVVFVPPGDHLMVRKWPSVSSAIRKMYDNSEMLSLTGRCKNTRTGVSFRIDTGGSQAAIYNKMKQANVWCAIWHDPIAGVFEIGWARGKFLLP